jgi:glycosyltransferase involved in cell wall biosynthesis
MKVLHCIASIDASYGGPVSALRGLCQGLNQRGVRSTVLTCSTGDPQRDAANAQAISEVDFFWSYPLVRRFYWEPFLTRRIENNLRDFDIVHVHGVFSGLTSSVCKTVRRLGIPYVLEPFGTLSPFCLSKSYTIKRISLAIEERKNIEEADALLFTSHAEWQRAQENFVVRRAFVAPIGLEWSEFESLPQRGAFREPNGIDTRKKVLLFLGRLHPIKGLEVFLPAFIHWCRSRPDLDNWKCVLVGPDEAGYLRKLTTIVSNLSAEDLVLFAGPLYGAQRIQALVDSDVVFLPSFHENFGVSVAEGMACGKPALVSDHVDLCSVVDEFELGAVAPVDEAGFIVALDKINALRDEWPSIGSRARLWVKENCNWERIAGSILDMYRYSLTRDRSNGASPERRQLKANEGR